MASGEAWGVFSNQLSATGELLPRFRGSPVVVHGRRSALTWALALLAACSGEKDAAAQRDAGAIQRAVARETALIKARADSIDAIFQPLPLLRPAQEAALRRFDNDAQLTAARRLGIEPNTPRASFERLVSAGRLARVPDSTTLWLVRKLDHSSPYLTQDALAALREIGERFQLALERLGLPAYRLEVTSALRSAEDQSALRRTNVNAAPGESTHQYGTTFDVAYNAFAAPARTGPTAIAEAPWLAPHLDWVAATLAESVAARRSREMMAILGNVLIEMQSQGKVMVTLERLQPVFHMTVARRF